jgi:hypothetical protein
MTITWEPWKKIILETGDIYVAHGGSKGILKLGPLQINQENEDGPPSPTERSVEDPYLDPWVRWLDKKDGDDFWNEEP